MKTLVTLLLMLLTIAAIAQRKPVNTIYLKNGSIIKGTVVEDKPGDKIKIETADKSIWVFYSSEVEKIEMPKQVNIPSDIDFTFRKRVFTQLQFEIMPSKKQSAEGTIPALLGMIGYQFNNHLSAGLGTGIEAFQISTMPLYGDVSYYFLNDRFTPFINLKAGYAFPLENTKDNNRNTNLESHSGLMGGIEIGYIKSLTNATRFTFSLGYRYQQLEQTGQMNQYNYYLPVPTGTSTYTIDRKITTDFNRIVMAIGLRFW